MIRFIDLLSEKIITDDRIDDLPEIVKASRECTRTGDCEAIIADNVASYMFSNSARSRVNFTSEDFPNVAPVFDSTFIEWLVPMKLYQGGGTFAFHSEYKDCYIGNHLMSAEVDDGWNCLSVYYSSYKGQSAINGWTTFHVNSDGSMKSIGRQVIMNELADKADEYYAGFEPETKSYVIAVEALFPALISLSFMHCKNVELKTVTPSVKLSRIHAKKTGRPLLKYKVLEIEPLKRILDSEGNAEQTGLKLALHICRGHFKDFSKGKGLFGKYKGLYWWDSQVRGDSKHGIVIKDYQMNLGAQS